MSKFNSYAKRIDKIATEAFKKYREAEAAYTEAIKKHNSTPQIVNGSFLPYAAEQARAQADFLDAKEAWRKAKIDFENQIKEIEAVREELKNEVEQSYTVDPTALDTNTVELLKSGILKSADYMKLMEEAKAAGNHTMTRVIAKYAKEEADRQTPNTAITRELNAVSYMADSGNGHLQEFDKLADVFNRTVRNPAMIDHWEELTAETVENF